MSAGEVQKDWAVRLYQSNPGHTPLTVLPENLFDGMGSSNMYFMRSYSDAFKDAPAHYGQNHLPPWPIALFGRETASCRDMIDCCTSCEGCLSCPWCCLKLRPRDVSLSITIVLTMATRRCQQPWFATPSLAFPGDKASVFVYNGRDMPSGFWAAPEAKEWIAVTWVASR